MDLDCVPLLQRTELAVFPSMLWHGETPDVETHWSHGGQGGAIGRQNGREDDRWLDLSWGCVLLPCCGRNGLWSWCFFSQSNLTLIYKIKTRPHRIQRLKFKMLYHILHLHLRIGLGIWASTSGTLGSNLAASLRPCWHRWSRPWSCADEPALTWASRNFNEHEAVGTRTKIEEELTCGPTLAKGRNVFLCIASYTIIKMSMSIIL